MRRLKLITALFLVTLFLSSFTADNEPKNFKQELRKEISNLIDAPRYDLLDETVHTSVFFTINNKNEVVVLSTGAEDYRIDSYLKRKLNYQKINIKGIQKGEVYKLPLTIEKSEI